MNDADDGYYRERQAEPEYNLFISEVVVMKTIITLRIHEVAQAMLNQNGSRDI